LRFARLLYCGALRGHGDFLQGASDFWHIISQGSCCENALNYGQRET
jgi:hypothetical protein